MAKIIALIKVLRVPGYTPSIHRRPGYPRRCRKLVALIGAAVLRFDVETTSTEGLDARLGTIVA